MTDLIGKQFGRLTVIERVEDHLYKNGRRDIVYKCRCQCGNETNVLAVHLRSGHTQSCGCYRIETSTKTMTTHGDTGDRKLVIWKNMKARCENPKRPDYPLYGGRGVTICKEWSDDYIAFRSWAEANGYDDSLTLDRIDVNGNYQPDNCRWVTQKEQCNNTRCNIFLEYDGQTHTVKQWSELLGIKYGTLISRIHRGWSAERALTI